MKTYSTKANAKRAAKTQGLDLNTICIYEQDGAVNGSMTANTNATVLSAEAFRRFVAVITVVSAVVVLLVALLDSNEIQEFCIKACHPSSSENRQPGSFPQGVLSKFFCFARRFGWDLHAGVLLISCLAHQRCGNRRAPASLLLRWQR